jgi:hypothetical protein
LRTGLKKSAAKGFQNGNVTRAARGTSHRRFLGSLGIKGKGSRVQGFKGSRVQGFKGSRVQGFKEK